MSTDGQTTMSTSAYHNTTKFGSNWSSLVLTGQVVSEKEIYWNVEVYPQIRHKGMGLVSLTQ